MNVLDYWNARAALGPQAGTPDLIAAHLEADALVRALAAIQPPPSRALELGCGLGALARRVARRGRHVTALDASPAMIAGALALAEDESVTYVCGDVLTLDPSSTWDVVYSQRCLINLPDWDAQHAALQRIAAVLPPGGRYLMSEASADGLDALNAARACAGLPEIRPPWHNRYLRDAELAHVTCLRLVQCERFSSTYYYTSRVIHAWQAQQRGEAPQYDAAINQLAAQLPGDGPYAQGRLWVWEKP